MQFDWRKGARLTRSQPFEKTERKQAARSTKTAGVREDLGEGMARRILGFDWQAFGPWSASARERIDFEGDRRRL